MIGIELLAFKCVDGAELHEYPPVRKAQKSVTIGGETREGLYVRLRSKNMRRYDRKLIDLKKPLIEEFLCCQEPGDFVNFASEYGLPGVTEETKLADLIKSRDTLRRLLDLHTAGKTSEAVKLYNKIAKPVTPFLAEWVDHPVMAFHPETPYGFMTMEAALAVANATVLLTCNHCTRPFLAGALTSKRTNAYYCSNKCRVAAQRAAEARG
ncbi:hypothetical protein [Bradyrhizobium tunisiense]|uniref:hypothetical protein n=1 Tax=Bradyrhizobium tunisiense TaxID=3278709 RepID=UPI0035E08F45